MAQIFLGLGSNIDEPLQQIQTAYQHLKQDNLLTITHYSSFYQSEPLGTVKQPDFINAVIAANTELDPIALLHYLQQVETKMGRKRLVRWGPRTIDLDILLYDDKIMNSEQLTIPHPGLSKREFVLYPLFEIAPNVSLPTGEKLSDLLKGCEQSSIKKLL